MTVAAPVSTTRNVSSVRPSHTKIVATVGPASGTVEKLTELITAGVDIFRVNTAHGTLEEHRKKFEMIRAAERIAHQPVAILVDLAGPKMRLGELPDNSLTCLTGGQVRFVRGMGIAQIKPDALPELYCTYDRLIDELRPGNRVMLADGSVALEVEEVDSTSAVCRIMQGGIIRSRQGVNLPGVAISAPALSDFDRDTAIWAQSMGADFISLSFVRAAEDVKQLKQALQDAAPKTDTAGRPWYGATDGNRPRPATPTGYFDAAFAPGPPHVIAKIEKPEALEHLEAIVREADGIMVARGDLGVEIDIAQMAVVQKRIVRMCHHLKRPVIIATQMLDSMHHSRLPTRAEATDVANAILDGGDACMLSGETAVGEYPVESVQMMHRIASATEAWMRTAPSSLDTPDPTLSSTPSPSLLNPVTEANAHAAVSLAETLNARMMVVATVTGGAALSLSKNRSFVPTIGVSGIPWVLRRMCLYYGVVPWPDCPLGSDHAILDFLVRNLVTTGEVQPGDRLVLLSGTSLPISRHNLIAVHEV